MRIRAERVSLYSGARNAPSLGVLYLLHRRTQAQRKVPGTHAITSLCTSLILVRPYQRRTP
jgi:hypothetical protein